jgi:hypothetical protein
MRCRSYATCQIWPALLTSILTSASAETGVYYDERGHPMLPSTLVRDPRFTERVVAETRALLSTIVQPA